MSVVAPSSPEPPAKARGAYFTPQAIATFLSDWAVDDDASSTVLDPTCGDGVFLVAAAARLRSLGLSTNSIAQQVIGVDVHAGSLSNAETALRRNDLSARLIEADFFRMSSPDQLDTVLPRVDAVIGNPPFVRYQQHRGKERARSQRAAAAQGVDLSGLASSWAALVVHSCAFLKPEGRLAMVLPAELLTVGYAAPIRRWLKRRFSEVHLVMFDELQFEDALEKVVLVVARGAGGCDALSVYHVDGSDDLARLGPFNHVDVVPAGDAKWTDFLIPHPVRSALNQTRMSSFVRLGDVASVELGTVTGANRFFALTERGRQGAGIPQSAMRRLCPQMRHITGSRLTNREWEKLRTAGERVWLFCPNDDDVRDESIAGYIASGERDGLANRYKCRIRDPWWRPPVVAPPDLFLSYMSHEFPRLVTNDADATCLNSLHAVRLRKSTEHEFLRSALPLTSLNTVTMLGAEIEGRSYGGGILKMEPREALNLPIPSLNVCSAAIESLQKRKSSVDDAIANRRWNEVREIVDSVVLVDAGGLEESVVTELRGALQTLRRARMNRPKCD